MAKVFELNLERGYPTVDIAIRQLVNSLMSLKRQGYKAVIVIHGYGSSGEGGAIKRAVKKKLMDRSLSGVVRCFCGGEEWSAKSREMIQMCGSLNQYRYSLSGNEGKTVILLR